jgi:type I restriction enzyme S subunit
LKFAACFPDSVVGFIGLGSSTLTRYLELFIRTARSELARYAPSTAQKNINLETLSALAVPLPPAHEQARMVEEVDLFMSVARHNETSLTTSLVRCARLRQSILKWAFEGKLADQDPTDEPASALLERIRSERAAASTDKKSPGRKPGRPAKKS